MRNGLRTYASRGVTDVSELATDRIGVLIVDDDPGVLALLCEVVGSAPGMAVVGSAASPDMAATLASTHRPEVALVDAKMPDGGGAHAAREIAVASPRTRIVALSAHKDRTIVLEMLRAGAMSYLVKGASNDAILDAVRRAVRGESTLAAEVAGGVVEELVVQLERQEGESERWRRQVARVRSVLGGPGLTMVVQPVFDLRTGELVGAEALARFVVEPWRTPDVWFVEAGLVGLGEELELAAVRTALRELPNIPGNAWLSVNVSPATVASPRFLDALADVPAERVVIEMTEHAPVGDYDTLAAPLSAVRRTGARLAIDDAGAGFASLRHVLRLKPDFIKLDITLSYDISRDPSRRALGRALISFAEEIGATVVAEGIESQQDLDTLHALGVTIGQGFHLARPRPLPLGDVVAAARARG